MNVFVLSEDIYECASLHCDKHVVKMILETAQLLCSVHHMTGSTAPYKLTHKNHPCSIWARENDSNYLWLCELGLALCAEYTKRYKKVHKTQAIIEWCIDNIPTLSSAPKTVHPLCMPDECKSDNIVDSYRQYYILKSKDIDMRYTQTTKPEWLTA